MNKYYVKIPYSYIQYGNLSGYIYAQDEEIAQDIARDTYNVQDVDYEDTDSDGTDYDYSQIEITLDEEDVVGFPASSSNTAQDTLIQSLPSYYLSEINSL